MRIYRTQNVISFGYKHFLKDYWKEGNLPDVVYDIYGEKLDEVTLEHIVPKSKGGASRLSNYALANKEINNLRGSDNIMKFTTVENIKKYLQQFDNVKLPLLDGKNYQELIINLFKKLGVDIKLK